MHGVNSNFIVRNLHGVTLTSIGRSNIVQGILVSRRCQCIFRRMYHVTNTWYIQWNIHCNLRDKSKVKWSRYRPGVAHGVGRSIALLFRDSGTRRGWVVSSTTRPHFTPGKDPVHTLQEARWAPGLVWTGGKSRPHRDSMPDRPARSKSLYRLR